MRVPEQKHGNSYLGDLHALLKKTFPEFRNRRGGLDVHQLSDHLEYSFQNMYLWFKSEKITPIAAKRIVERSRGRLKLEQLQKFVYAD